MTDTDRVRRKIILETGEEYAGYLFGSENDKVLEIVFNTSMTGYQEIMSDPSYTDQAVVMAYPWIGNYGMAADDYETEKPSVGAMIVRDYNDEPSHCRSEESLGSVMKRHGISGVYGVDTRKLVRTIRSRGSRKVLITGPETTLEQGLEILRRTEIPHDAVSRVSCRESWTAHAECEDFHVVAIDCGMKRNIVRSLVRHSCKVTVVPWNTAADEIRMLEPDGIFLSNGPGDPQDVPETVHTVRELIGYRPVFGICLGHQLTALAYGAKTYKLKFGHRGGNHPVRNINTGRIEITSQNHSYAVDPASLEGTPLEITHINVLDNTVEGMRCTEDMVFSVQYHPESAPGPNDSGYLFGCFIDLMRKGREHA